MEPEVIEKLERKDIIRSALPQFPKPRPGRWPSGVSWRVVEIKED